MGRIGVGDSTEALELRSGGVTSPLLILGTVIDSEIPYCLEHDIEVGVHSQGRAAEFGAAADQAGKRLGVHLNIDTGMGRLGVRPDAALRAAQAVLAEPALELRGVMTHISSPAGMEEKHTREQQALFDSVLAELAASSITPGAVHLANSASLFTGLSPLADAVRPGIALYGVLPSALDREGILRPVMSLHGQIAFLKDIREGAPVGYGARWRAHTDTRIATIPLGYHDGLPYRLGAQGRGEVLIRGRRCPIVGAVSMDYTTVDVGHVPGVSIGDTATFFGQAGEERIRAEEVAEAAGTIAYEIVCSVGTRVRRVYTGAARSLEMTP